LESEPTTIAGIAAVLEILATDPYEDEAAAIDDACPGGSTTLGLAYGGSGGHQAVAANDLMLRLAETLRGLQLRAQPDALRMAAAAG
jgi:hypothetical protein